MIASPPADRRSVMKAMLLGGASGLLPVSIARAAMPQVTFAAAPIGWIDGAPPARNLGQTFGVPWPRGAVKRGQALTVRAEGGGAVPSQHWTLATWPDGSVKWSAHALPAGSNAAGYSVERGRGAAPREAVRVSETADVVVIRVGDTTWTIGKTGSALVREARRGGRVVMGPVDLVAATVADPDGGVATPFVSEITSIVVEQDGPVRAVVRIEGVHRGGGRDWLPFTVRLIAHAGAEHLRIVHSFIFDGDPARDFISGLGLRTAVPMRAALHDRHIRLATDGGLFAEAVRPLTGLRRDPGRAFREAQVAGRATPPLAEMGRQVREGLERIPAWGDFALQQLSANGFTLRKRTGSRAWLDRCGRGAARGGPRLCRRSRWRRGAWPALFLAAPSDPDRHS